MGRIFITYNPVETETAAALGKALRGYGHQVWFDREFAGGAAWWKATCKRIAACDILIYVVSPSSIQCEYCQATLTETRRWQTPVIVAITDASIPIPAAVQTMPAVTLSGKSTQRTYERLHHLIEEQIRLHPSRSVMPLWEEPSAEPKVKLQRRRYEDAGNPHDRLVFVALGGVVIFFLALVIIARILQTTSISPSDVARQPTQSTDSVPAAVAVSATWTQQVPPTASNTPRPTAAATLMAAASSLSPTPLPTSIADVRVTATPQLFSDLFATDVPNPGGTPTPTATLAPGDPPYFEIVDGENDAAYQSPAGQATGTPTANRPGQGSRIYSNNSTLRISLPNGTVLVLLPQSELTLNQVSAPNSVVVTLWAGEVFVDNRQGATTSVIAPTVNLEMHTHQGQMAISTSPIIALQCFEGECQAKLSGSETVRDLSAGEQLTLNSINESMLTSMPAMAFTQEQIDQYDTTCQGCLSGAEPPASSSTITDDKPTTPTAAPSD